MGFDFEFILKGVDKCAKHVEQHALAAVSQNFENLHVDQCRKHNGLFSVNRSGVIDLAHRLVGFVNGVDEGQPNMAVFGFKLGQNGGAKSLCRNGGAVRYEKHTSIWHSVYGLTGF
jgi:hypothetical protein